MTEREKSLLKDLVDISISAQKVILSGSYPISKMEEVVLLREMTAHVLVNYTKVKENKNE